MNIAVVQGRIRTTPDRRVARDGSSLVSFDVVIDGVPARQVPVTWAGPVGKEPAAIVAGRRVTIIGSVDRRFYRRAGATMSRTDVRAERVLTGTGQRATASAITAIEKCLVER